jgi:hypothetical protein
MTSMADRADTRPRDRMADLLTAVVAGASAFSSWTGWVLLGHYAGWPKQGLPGDWEFDTAWLNPISVDVLAYLGMRAWVAPGSSDTAKAWGRGAALGALGLSIVGNALGHTLGHEGKNQPDPGQILLSVGLAAMAPVILVVVLHLRTLRAAGGQPAAVTHPEMAPAKEMDEADGSDGPIEVTPKPEVAPIPAAIPQATPVAAAAIQRGQVHVPISGETDLWTTEEARAREATTTKPRPAQKPEEQTPKVAPKPKAGGKEARPEDIEAAQKLIKAGALTESPTADQIKEALHISLAYARPVRDHLQALQHASQKAAEEAEGSHS